MDQAVAVVIEATFSSGGLEMLIQNKSNLITGGSGGIDLATHKR